MGRVFSRFNDADVHVEMMHDHLECVRCSLGRDRDFRSTEAMIAHLERHQAEGDYVPDKVMRDLRYNDANNFPVDRAAPVQ